MEHVHNRQSLSRSFGLTQLIPNMAGLCLLCMLLILLLVLLTTCAVVMADSMVVALQSSSMTCSVGSTMVFCNDFVVIHRGRHMISLVLPISTPLFSLVFVSVPNQCDKLHVDLWCTCCSYIIRDVSSIGEPDRHLSTRKLLDSQSTCMLFSTMTSSWLQLICTLTYLLVSCHHKTNL